MCTVHREKICRRHFFVAAFWILQFGSLSKYGKAPSSFSQIWMKKCAHLKFWNFLQHIRHCKFKIVQWYVLQYFLLCAEQVCTWTCTCIYLLVASADFILNTYWCAFVEDDDDGSKIAFNKTPMMCCARMFFRLKGIGDIWLDNTRLFCSPSRFHFWGFSIHFFVLFILLLYRYQCKKWQTHIKHNAIMLINANK